MKAAVPKWLWIASSMLITFSFIPSLELRMTLWALLAIPFQWLYSPPLVYRDKPWYLTYSGGVVTAICWSLSLLAIVMLTAHLKRKGPEQR
jgi:hypothetical protein